MSHIQTLRILILALLLLTSGPAFASRGGTPAEAVTDYQRLLRTEMNVLQVMDDLDERLRRQELELEKLQSQRQRIAVHLLELEVRFERATRKLEKERKLIQKRLGAIVRFRRWSRADMLLNPQDFLKGSRRDRVLRLLLDADRERISAYRERLQNFELERALLDHRRKELDGMENNISNARGALDAHRQDRREILRLVREERAWYDKAYADLRKAYDNVTKEILRLETWQDKRLEFGRLKGEFRLPMSYAKIVTPYGVRPNKRLKTATLHQGVEIKSKGSESVRAVYWGRVAFIGRMPGYGMTIILDHTEGYHTLESRLKRTLVKEGEIVESRQVLGTVGGASALGTPGTLYLELRHEGKAVDPSPWFRDA